jgi:hypothetical protein
MFIKILPCFPLRSRKMPDAAECKKSPDNRHTGWTRQISVVERKSNPALRQSIIDTDFNCPRQSSVPSQIVTNQAQHTGVLPQEDIRCNLRLGIGCIAMAGAALDHPLRTKQPGFAGIGKRVVVHVEEPDIIVATSGLVESRTLRQRLADRMMAVSDFRRVRDGITIGAAINRLRQHRQASKNND